MHAYNMENTNEMVVKKIAKTHKKEGDKHFLEKNISKALSSYQKAENHIKSIYSADYYKCASIYRRLGIVYDQLNNSLSVIDYFQKYIKIKSSRSIKDAKVGFAYYSLSKHYGITRNQEYKLHYLQKCIIIYEHIYNPDNLILAFPFQELGVCYKDSGNYENSFKYLEKCRILREKVLPPTDYAIAIIYSHLGSYYTDIGNTTKSFEYLTKYLKILEENHPTYQLDIAAGYDNISVYYINIGDYSKALESLEKSRKIKEKSIAHDNIEYFTFYNSLGALHQKIGNLELATEYLEKSIKIGERYYSPEQPELITVKNNYASILSLKGDHEKIAKIIAENQSHSESDPRAGISYLNQAMINLGQGNTEQSQILLEKSKKILEGANPRNKLLLAKLYNNYSQFYRKVGNKQQEKYYLDKCEEITTTIEEVDKELIGNLYSNLGLYYSEIGDKIRSIEYYEKSLGIFNKATIDNQALATIYSNLALEYCSAGNKNEALSILLKCKTVFEKPGTDKKMHGNICNSIAMIYGDFKDRQKQKEYLQQAKKLLKETLQPNEIMLTQVYENLSICYVESGLISRGLKILEKCTKLFEKYHANNFTALSNNYSNLGILYCRVNNLSSGLKYLEKCKEIRERFFPPFHEELTNIYDNLSKCCGLLGLFDKQFEYLEKCRVVLEGNDSHGINLSNLYFNLASCYWMGKNMVKCMEFIEKSKDIADPCMLEESDLPNSFTKIFPRCSYATVYNEWRFLKELSKFPHYFLRISTIRKSENENECENEFRIHMDRCKMTFLDAISDRIQFSERDFKVILSQLSEAFSILKSKRIVHGDVSPGNIGIGNDNYTKIIDFGNARLLLEEVGSPDFVFIKPNSRVSWEYIAPEVFFWGKYKEKLRIVEIRYDPFKADIFSLGLTLLSCLHVEIRGLNDYNENPPQIIPLKLKYGYSFVASKPEYVKEYRKVIRNLQKRIDFTIENIRGYESVKHILKSMLRVDIEERVCVEDLFKSVFILNQGFDA